MGTAITSRAPQLTRAAQSLQRLPELRQIFNSTQTIQQILVLAVTHLSACLQTEIQQTAQQAWVQNLERYSPSELLYAFERAEREVAAFPTPAHLVEMIETRRFHEALAVVLTGLPTHGIDWLDIPERQTWRYAAAHETAHTNCRGRERVVLWIPAVPAPKIPEQMVRALGVFGGTGRVSDGLKRLKHDHPALWNGNHEVEPGAHGRQQAAMESDLFRAWMEAA